MPAAGMISNVYDITYINRQILILICLHDYIQMIDYIWG